MAKFVFHVVSSVKGGCGKSTFALYLANYLVNDAGDKRDKNDLVYLIDLDTSGTSWYEDYKRYYSGSIKSNKFLNDIIYDHKLIKSSYPWWHFNKDGTEKFWDKWKSDGNRFCDISLCIANPEKQKYMPEYQIDLFEQAVKSLIEEDIIKKYKEEKEKAVHIILDMPPGTEAKAERIFRHSLPEIMKQDPEEYEIKLYMLSNLSNSSAQANWAYVKGLFKPSSYYDQFPDLLVNKKMSIRMIFNDISDLGNHRNADLDAAIDPYDVLFAEVRKSHELQSFFSGKTGMIYAVYIPYIECIPSRYTHLELFDKKYQKETTLPESIDNCAYIDVARKSSRSAEDKPCRLSEAIACERKS